MRISSHRDKEDVDVIALMRSLLSLLHGIVVLYWWISVDFTKILKTFTAYFIDQHLNKYEIVLSE